MGRSRSRPLAIHSAATSDGFHDDVFSPHGRHARRQKIDRVATEELQYGAAPRGVCKNRGLWKSAHRRRFPVEHSHKRGGLCREVCRGCLRLSQTALCLAAILSASGCFWKRARTNRPPLSFRTSPRTLDPRAFLARIVQPAPCFFYKSLFGQSFGQRFIFIFFINRIRRFVADKFISRVVRRYSFGLHTACRLWIWIFKRKNQGKEINAVLNVLISEIFRACSFRVNYNFLITIVGGLKKSQRAI